MYRKIRITVASLVVMVICVLSSVGTLSYFTDIDSKSNDFTIGNASSDLMIYNDGAGDEEHIFSASDYTLVPGMPDIPYYLQAKNDGNIPVYQRFRVVIPIALANAMTLELPCTLGELVDGVRTCSSDDYDITYDSSVNVGAEPTYAEYYIVSKNLLDVNRTTSEWPVTAIKVGDIPDGITESSEIVTCMDNDSNKCVLGIRAYSDVIQTTVSESATQAFEDFTETY